VKVIGVGLQDVTGIFGRASPLGANLAEYGDWYDIDPALLASVPQGEYGFFSAKGDYTASEIAAAEADIATFASYIGSWVPQHYFGTPVVDAQQIGLVMVQVNDNYYGGPGLKTIRLL
jgi:hypothetical protein